MQSTVRALLAALFAGLGAMGAQAAPEAVPAQAARVEADQRFQRYAAQALENYLREFPETAVALGRYEFADKMTVPDQASRTRAVAFYDRQLAALVAFDPASLPTSSRVDRQLMLNEFASSRWSLLTFKEWEWQPSQYNVGDSFGRLLTTEYAPLDTRLRHVLARMVHVPAYYAAARAAISKPTLEHTQLALLQNKGALDIFNDDLAKKAAASGLSADEKQAFATRLAATKAAISGHLEWLTAQEAALQQGGARSFRIGKALYAQKFAYDIQSGFTADQLYARARDEKARLHDQMEKLARELWPQYMAAKPLPADRLELIRAVIDELSKRHTAPETFVDTVRKQIPALEAFVREKDLVEQDPTRPLVVRETPTYMRGVAGASVSAPGPFDPTANTYYNVDPLDDWTPEQAESYLREYNDWMLQILNIHEAIPGHYTQLVHANKSKSTIKSIFGNGSMIEGWAVFSEKVMLDAGYGNHAPEMWLIWMKWNLRSVVNTILDYEIHTQGLERDAAITLMTREAFQQQAEATGKWRRATL
ncbi:MAG: DUF885 domain-containing protein, partial [Rhodoferax sp.]|nr:DUF885 domain-containing protein [Rhodoferax sp.]